MAYMVIEINVSSDSIADINATVPADSSKPHSGVRGCVNVLEAILSGMKDGTVKVVSKDIATTISTSGTGSASTTFNLA